MLGIALPHALSSRARRAVAAALVVLSVTLAACSNGDDADAEAAVSTDPPPLATAEVTASPTPTATPTSTPQPTPTPASDVRPVRCHGLDGDALQARLDDLGEAIEAAMEGYNGEWGFGMVDLDCDVEFAVRPEHVQYTASAGKIVPVIAALRLVEEGALAMAAVEPHLLPVMEHSLDHDADVINSMVTPAQVQEVLELSDVSDATRFEHQWRQAFMPALDLARVWAALLEGDLLGEELTEYLLDLASRPEIPLTLETFPLDSGLPEFQIGQKAGYYVYDGIPYYLLGAGYLRPVAGDPEEDEHAQFPAAEERGLALVFALRSLNPDLSEPQRRTVFPLVVEYVSGQPVAER